MMNSYYPPVNFHFLVSFNGIGNQKFDTQFQSVSGLKAEMKTETYKEGGENRFEHKLPTGADYSPLILKRGLIKDSTLIKWFRDTIETMQISPISIAVMLLNPENMPLMTWNLVHAWPIKWEISEFNAMESAIVIETLELNYRYFTVVK